MVFDLDDGFQEKRNVHNLSQWWALAIVTGVLLLSSISKYQLYSLPRALTANDEVTHKRLNHTVPITVPRLTHPNRSRPNTPTRSSPNALASICASSTISVHDPPAAMPTKCWPSISSSAN